MKLSRSFCFVVCLMLLCSCSQEEATPKNEDSAKQPDTSPGRPDSTSAEKVKAKSAKTKPAFDPGIKVGEKAPGFQLMDQNGEEHSLDELLKKGNTALVFFRSADW